MPDDEGFSVAGELPLGAYAALEGDLGESLAGPLGFSAVRGDVVVADESYGVPGFPSRPFAVTYEVAL